MKMAKRKTGEKDNFLLGQLTSRCIQENDLQFMDPKGIPKRSVQNVKFYSSSQVRPQNMCLTHS